MSDMNASASTRPRRSQLSFSLPMLLMVVLLASVYFAWIGNILVRVRHQRAIVAKLESLGATVDVEYEHRPGSMLIKYVFGDDTFDQVKGVGLIGSDSFEDDNLALLVELPEIEGLFLSGRHITDRGMQYVAQLPKLELLGLDSTSVTAEGLAQLAAADGLETLLCSGVTLTDETLKSVGMLSNLRELGFMESKNTSADFEHLAGLRYLNKLAVFDSSMDEIRNLDQLRSLEVLALHNVSIGDDGCFQLGGLSHLKSLHVGSTTLSDSVLRHLADLQNLEFLTLHGESITDGVLMHLAGLHRLEELRLNGTKVGDEGLAHLAGLEKLQSLWLGSTEVSDAGLQHIAAIKPLRSLFLHDSKVSGDGLAMVKRLNDLGPDCNESKQTVIDELNRLFPSNDVQ